MPCSVGTDGSAATTAGIAASARRRLASRVAATEGAATARMSREKRAACYRGYSFSAKSCTTFTVSEAIAAAGAPPRADPSPREVQP